MSDTFANEYTLTETEEEIAQRMFENSILNFTDVDIDPHMEQTDWIGYTCTETDLTVLGDLLWDSADEGFQAPIGVRFENVGSETVYIHIPGFHVEGNPTDPTTWTFTALTVNSPTIDIICRNTVRGTGGLTKCYGWSVTGAGALIWTPIITQAVN